jgi:RimJ/RimL family protein N-acetyltransferase
MWEILFFRIDCDSVPPPIRRCPTGTTIEIWRPAGLALAPACSLSPLSRMAWWAFHHLRIFGNRDHAVVWLRRDNTCVHRTLLIPSFFRFPFMASSDLQCSDIWTAPNERGRGLAAAGVAAALRHGWKPGRRIWYLTEAGNEPSCRLARNLGFSLVGCGQRTRPLGLRVFGQFLMTTSEKSVR